VRAEAIDVGAQGLAQCGLARHRAAPRQDLVAGARAERDAVRGGRRLQRVPSYIDVLLHRKPGGRMVAIVGAGGIGLDLAEYVATGTDLGHRSPTLDLAAWLREWGVADPEAQRGGLARPQPEPPVREVLLLQRKPGRHGATLGKTIGWIQRAALKMKNVEMLSGVNYERIGPSDEPGRVALAISFGAKCEDATVLALDTIVLCASQEPLRELRYPLAAAGIAVHPIGGALEAGELDAKCAIDQGTRLAAAL
jgi:2,4-dienoyl-CoA reductase (NADPH2)